MRKRRLFVAFSTCLMLALSFGNAASAAVITFDQRPQLELMKLPGSGQVAKPNGTYIAGGTCGISEIGAGHVRISADTSCYRKCAKVDATATLYQVNGSYYDFQTDAYGCAYDAYDVGVYKDWYVERQKYYQVQGGHNATAYDGTLEPTVSWTNIVYVS